jgi:hypothetical protein
LGSDYEAAVKRAKTVLLPALDAWCAARKLGEIKPSAFPGGIVRSRDRKNPNAVQPLIGVYLLLLRYSVVYIGESLNMPERVAAHRSNGRPFDQVYYIATTANQRAGLERILIRAINPPGNRRHRTNGSDPGAPDKWLGARCDNNPPI